MPDKYENMKAERARQADVDRAAKEQGVLQWEENKRQDRDARLAEIQIAKSDFLREFEAYRHGLRNDGFELGEWRWGAESDDWTSWVEAELTFAGERFVSIDITRSHGSTKFRVSSTHGRWGWLDQQPHSTAAETAATVANHALNELGGLQRKRTEKLVSEKLAADRAARGVLVISILLLSLAALLAWSYLT